MCLLWLINRLEILFFYSCKLLNYKYPTHHTFNFVSWFSDQAVTRIGLQIVGMAVYSFLVVAFYTFLGLFLGNRTAEITVTSTFSFVVIFLAIQILVPLVESIYWEKPVQTSSNASLSYFQALSVMFLFIRCTSIDPTDKTSSRKKKRVKSKAVLEFNYGFILTQLVVRFFRRLERKILRTFIRRKYLDPWKTSMQLEPLLPFPLVMKDDAVSPETKEEDISFCSLCDFEVCHYVLFLQ